MSVFIRKISLANYRSIAQCEVELGPVTFLVGANGSGKSNFLDALAFAGDCVDTTPERALRLRGGVDDVRRRSGELPADITIRIDLVIDGTAGHHAFRIHVTGEGTWSISHEECRLGPAFYSVREGVVQGTAVQVMPPAADDRLYLANAAGLPEFRPVYDSLFQLRTYNINPESICELQAPSDGHILDPGGGNMASVVASLDRPERGATKQRILEYLRRVAPEITDFHARRLGRKATIEFVQAVDGAEQPVPFLADCMSDGTLRALGVLVALFPETDGVSLVGVEEPETSLHPAAARALRDAILEASERTQVLITSHSPELLDDTSIDASMLRAVVSKANRTVIGPVDESIRSTLRDHLFTAGELLRSHQLAIDPAAHQVRPIRFFESDPE